MSDPQKYDDFLLYSADFMRRYEAVGAKIDVKALDHVLDVTEESILTAYHLVNFVGFWCNGGIALFQQSLGIDARTIGELRGIGMNNISDVVRLFGDGKISSQEANLEIKREIDGLIGKTLAVVRPLLGENQKSK